MNVAVVLVSDRNYFTKAKQTILDIRSRGKWSNDIVLITIDFDVSQNFIDFYNIQPIRFPIIDKTELINKIKKYEYYIGGDGRELNKLNQWEKFHVFDEYFKKWSKIIFFDAGLRVLEPIKHLLELDCKGSILMPNDTGNYPIPKKLFKEQITMQDPFLVNNLLHEFGSHILESEYFLNCIWIYDTSILDICKKQELIDVMNKYPLCKTNEMTVMNLLFHFKYNLCKEFPIKARNNKILFEWCELNNPAASTWRDYCFIKYPISIPFHEGM